MPPTTYHMNDGDSGLGDLRPYVFQRDGADVVREAFTTLLAQRVAGAGAERLTSADAIILEQRQTMFASDSALQEFFCGDFAAFCAALDAPWRFGDQLAAHTPGGARPANVPTWDDVLARSREWKVDPADDRDAPPTLDEDTLYHHAFQWTCRVERWSRRLLAEQKQPDAAVVRVATNAPFVPVKIAYGFAASFADDRAGIEVALVGYRQTAIFCMRALESLGVCYGKRIGAAKTLHGFLDEGRELLADIESVVAELESELRFRRGHE